jgi:hypothetical protein
MGKAMKKGLYRHPIQSDIFANCHDISADYIVLTMNSLKPLLGW